MASTSKVLTTGVLATFADIYYEIDNFLKDGNIQCGSSSSALLSDQLWSFKIFMTG